jgi:hypothetical protein
LIYVNVEGVKSEGRGHAGGSGWHDTDDVAAAVEAELRRFHSMWDHLGHGAIETYRITVAPEASPAEPDPLVERVERLRRLCLNDSTNYTAQERAQHRSDLKAAEAAIREVGG